MAISRFDKWIYSAALVLPRLPGFLMLPIIASILSLKEMGILASSWVFIELFQTLAGMGLKAALGRYFPMAQTAQSRHEILTITLGGMLLGGLALSAITFGIFSLPIFNQSISFLQSIDYKILCTLLIAAMIGNLSSTFIIYFRVEQKAWGFLFASLIGGIFELGLFIFLYKIGKISLLNLLGIECLKQFAMLVFIALSARKDWGLAFSKNSCLSMLHFGLWLMPVGLGEWFITSSDRFWLGQHGDLGPVGIYGFMYKFAMPIGILFTGGIMDLHAQLYRMNEKEGLTFTNEKLKLFLSRSGLFILGYALIIPIAMFFILKIRPVFPAIYSTGLPIFPILIAILYVFYWSKYYSMVLEFKFKARSLTLTMVLSALASLALIPMTLYLFKIFNWNILIGAAIGSLLAQLLALTISAKLAKLEGSSKHFLKGSLFIFFCLIFSWALTFLK